LDQLGAYRLQIIAGDAEHSVIFDGGAGHGGWNAIDRFDLPEGPVEVVLASQSDGDIVVADAIRWSPVNPIVVPPMQTGYSRSGESNDD